MLNLTYVRTFVCVIDGGGFREAARRLKCSQPTVSQHIKKLEAAMKTALVARSHAQCTATSQGRRFLPLARSLLRVADRARAAVEARELVIGASTNVGTYLLPPCIKSFTDSGMAPANVDLVIASNPEVAEKLAAGEVDVAVMEWWDSRPGFSALAWRQEPLVVIVPPDHPWAELQSVPKEKLLASPMIGGEAGTGTARVLARVFGDAARDLEVGMTLGSTEAVKQAVKAGLGISITLARAVEQEVASGLLHALAVAGERLTKTIFVILPQDAPPTSAAAVFTDVLMSPGKCRGSRRGKND